MSALLLMLLTGPSSALAAPFLVHRFPVMASSFPHTQRAGGRLLYFMPYGDPRLWRTDGTPEGTVPLLPEGHPYGIRPLAPDDLATLGDAAYFVLPNEGPERRVWRSDGTAAGTVPQDILRPQTMAGGEQTLYVLTVQPELFRNTLWRIERGSGGGDSPPILTGTTSNGFWLPGASDGVVTAGRLFFRATTVFSQFGEFTDRTQLWTSDGSGFGELVLDFADLVPPSFYRQRIQETAVFGGRIALYATPNNENTTLWINDGTTEGTIVIQAEPAIDNPSAFGFPIGRLGSAGGRLFFWKRAPDGSRPRLWTSDGTPAGTRVVLDESLARDRPFPDDPTAVIDVQGTGYFLAWKATAGAGRSGYALWRTDGTAAGTRPVADLPLSEHGLLPKDLGHAGDTFLFWHIATPGGAYGHEELWGVRPGESNLDRLRAAVAQLPDACDERPGLQPALARVRRQIRRTQADPAEADRALGRVARVLRALRGSAVTTLPRGGVDRDCRRAITRAIRRAVEARAA